MTPEEVAARTLKLADLLVKALQQQLRLNEALELALKENLRPQDHRQFVWTRDAIWPVERAVEEFQRAHERDRVEE